jgi:hypothetical protein
VLQGAKKAAVERLASLGSIAAVALLLKFWGQNPFGDHATYALATAAALSFAHPGLGPAALLAYLAFSLALSGGIWFVLALLILPAAAFSIRFWPQSALWAIALSTVHLSLVNYVSLAALIFSLQYSTSSLAAALMAFYALAANVKLAAALPPGTLGCGGLVVAVGSAAADGSSLESVSNWFYANFLGPPQLLFQTLVFAVSGAAAAKLSDIDGGKKIAALAPAAAILFAHYAVATKLGLNLDISTVAMPLATALFTVVSRKPTLQRPRQQLPKPPLLLEHLDRAWLALLRLLKQGEKVVLVFGPKGCGKTMLIAEACAASGFEVAYDGDFRGKVVHIESAEHIPDLEEQVFSALKRGARCVVLETSRPIVVAEKLKRINLRKAVYVPPPDKKARARVLEALLGGALEDSQLAELAEATEGYSLKALIQLAEQLRKAPTHLNSLNTMSGLQQSGEIPLLTKEELAELERFMLSFNGLLMGFAI